MCRLRSSSAAHRAAIRARATRDAVSLQSTGSHGCGAACAVGRGTRVASTARIAPFVHTFRPRAVSAHRMSSSHTEPGGKKEVKKETGLALKYKKVRRLSLLAGLPLVLARARCAARLPLRRCAAAARAGRVVSRMVLVGDCVCGAD